MTHSDQNPLGSVNNSPTAGSGEPVILNPGGKPYAHQANTREKVKGFIERIPQGDRLMIFLTGVIAVSAISTILVSWWSNNAASRQVDRLIGAANRVAGAAEGFSGSASNINGGISSAVEKLSDQATQMESARRSSEASSRSALQATIDGFHNENRAWVGISAAIPERLSAEANQSMAFIVGFTLRNYGRSAANNVRFLAKVDSDPGDELEPPCDELAATVRAGEVLLPTQEVTYNWVMNLTHEQMIEGWKHQNAQLNRQLFLRVRGRIQYDDKKDERPPHRTPIEYFVFHNRGGPITADTKLVPGNELDLTPFGYGATHTQ